MSQRKHTFYHHGKRVNKLGPLQRELGTALYYQECARNWHRNSITPDACSDPAMAQREAARWHKVAWRHLEASLNVANGVPGREYMK